MSNAIQDLGFQLERQVEDVDPFEPRGDDWRCRGCSVRLSRLRRVGHGPDCPELARLLRAAPRPSRAHIVDEWPGLRDTLQKDAALVSNALEVARSSHAKERKRRQRAGQANGVEVLARLERLIADYQIAAQDWRRLVESEGGG